jgi:hypothetical protein
MELQAFWGIGHHHDIGRKSTRVFNKRASMLIGYARSLVSYVYKNHSTFTEIVRTDWIARAVAISLQYKVKGARGPLH